MRTQPRIAVGVVYRILGVAAFVALLFTEGCATKSSAPTTPSLSAVVSGLGSLRPNQVGAAYTIAVSNASGAAPTNGTVTVTDPPTNFTVTAISGSGWTCIFASLTCTRSDALAAGSAYPVITVTGNVTGAAGQNISVPIGITGGGQTTTTNSNGSVVIVLPPTITSGNATTFTVGTSGAFTATATGFPAPTFTETGALPTGVTLSSAGVLSGTPAAATGGTYTITLTAQNGVTPNATQGFTLTVNQAPAISSASNAAFTVGTAGTFAVTATGFPAPTFAETGALPTGVALNPTTGVLSGAPATGTQGAYPITITATNGIGTNATQSFTLNVDLAPAFTSGTSTTFTVGTPGTFTATASGFPAPTFTETGALPNGVTLTAAGVLSGNPAPGTGTTYNITLTATNGAGTPATQSFTLTVDQAPAITSANATTFAVGSPSTFTVTATGFPAPTFSETGSLPNGVTLSAAGTLSGTPASNTQGAYPITITATNGIGTNATQSFTLNVDLAPVFTSGTSTTFTVGTPGTFTATASGFPAPTFTETGALPSGVTLTAAGVLSGNPAPGTGTTYNITLTATNGAGTPATQSFTLTVDQAPAVTSGTSTTFAVGTPQTFTVTASGFPAPTFSETGTLPTGVTLSPAGTLSGTPASSTQGAYPITITATNGIGTNATQSFTLNVDLAPAFTSGNSTTFTVGTPGTFTATASGFPVPTFTETGALPTGVTLTAAGVLSGNPAPGTGTTYNITLTATNGAGTPATQSFTLTVDQAPAITSANATTFAVNSLSSFTVAATGFPAPTFSEAGSLPNGVTLSPAGTLSGTPASGTQTGSPYIIAISASNGVGTPSAQTFTLSVSFTAPPSFTSSASTTFTAGTLGTFTVTASGSPAATFSVTAGSLPSGITLNPTTGVLSGIPAATAGGTYPITITAQNTISPNATQNFTLTVDQAPAITSGTSITFTAAAPSTFTVAATGFPAPTFSETGALPPGVTLNSAGLLAGTPGASAGGTYNITITATNGVGANATQAFTLTVDQGPTITSQNNTTFTAGTAGTFTVTAVGTPAPTFTETGTLPNGVTLTTSGVLSGIPSAGGTYNITLTAANGVGAPGTQSFTLTVDQAPAITSSSSASFAVNASGSFTVTTTGFPAPSLSEVGSLPGTVTFVNNGNGTATISGTSTASGSSPITITASNGIGSNATQSFTLTVTTGPPTVQISQTNALPIQAGGATKTFNITVTNDVSGDLPTVTSFTFAGVACTPSTCGTFSAVTGTAGSGSYSVVFTPLASLTTAISPTFTVSPSVARPWFAGTASFTVNPAGIVVTQTAGFNVVAPGSGLKQAIFTVYNDVNNAGVTITLTGSGYSCASLPTNSCGSLGTPTVTTNGTTTTTTVLYTPPATVPVEPYDRVAIQGTSVADPTKLFHQNFLLSSIPATALLSIPYGQKLDSIVTGGAAVTVAANFTDTTATKTATWQILANGVTCTTCGTLGTPVVTSNGNAVTSTITYTPPTVVPTGAGQNTPTITATMNANSAATDNFSFSIVNGACGTGKNSLLTGSYAFLLRGSSATGGYITSVGSFTTDGNGNITGGLLDRNSSAGVTTDNAITGGTYSVGTDNRGCLQLATAGGSTTYRIALGTVSSTTATQGTIQVFTDDTGQGARLTGILKLQNLTNVTSATLDGTYAFGREGMDSSGHRLAAAGLLTANGAGALSGITFDIDDNGTFGTLSGGSGTYALASNAPSGRGTAQTTITTTDGSVTANYAVYAISSSDGFIVSTDPADANHPIISGEDKLQTGPFSTSGLTNGSGYVFYAAGIDPSNGASNTVLGQSQFTNGSGAATVTLDENDNGVSEPEASGSATFAVTSAGKMTGTGAILGNPPIIYLVDSTQGFIVGTDSNVSAGYVQKQTLSSFSTSTITGQFFFGGGAPVDGGSYDTGTVTFTPGSPTGTISGTDDESGPNNTLDCTQNCGGGGLQPNNPISGNGGGSSSYTFSASPTAPGQGNVGGGSIAYIISPSKLLFIQSGTAQNTNPAEVFIIQQ